MLFLKSSIDKGELVSITQSLILLVLYIIYYLKLIDWFSLFYILILLSIIYLNTTLYNVLLRRSRKEIIWLFPIIYILSYMISSINHLLLYLSLYIAITLLIVNIYPQEVLDTLYNITRYRLLFIVLLSLILIIYVYIGIGYSILFIVITPFIEILLASIIKDNTWYTITLYSIVFSLSLFNKLHYILYTIGSIMLKTYIVKYYIRRLDTTLIIDYIVRTSLIWLIVHGA